MNIGLYFGSFNPIHVGHLIIAEFVQQHTDVEQVWFVVSPQNPFKPSSSLLNSYHRLHLVRLAIGDSSHLQVSDIEFKLPVPSYTVDTLTYLQEKNPSHNYKIILGSDSFQNISKWKNGHILLKNFSFIIYNRPKFPVLNYDKANCRIVEAPLLEISSTYIRQQIQSKKSVRYLLPDTVYDEIIRNRYYQQSEKNTKEQAG